MKQLRIAIQKSGRLNNNSLKLLRECGISINNGNDQLKTAARNFPLELLYLRNGDIPQYVEDGVADIAIVGENILIEQEKEIEIVEKLGFAKCRLSIALPKETDYTGVQDLEGKRIATSYPNSLQKFLDINDISADLHKISGSVEIAPNIGLADAICDLVSSGSTLFKNSLKEVELVLSSEACLVKSKNLDDETEKLLHKLQFRIKSVLKAKNSKYILLNAPNEKLEVISSILPVLKSPTILPLAIEGWSSIHSVIEEKTFWNVIDQLKEAGAENILVIPIEKMV